MSEPRNLRAVAVNLREWMLDRNRRRELDVRDYAVGAAKMLDEAADALAAAEAERDALRAKLEAVRALDWIAFEGATISADHYASVDRIRALLDAPERETR